MSNSLEVIRSAKESDIKLLDKELENGADINEEGSYLLLNATIFGRGRRKKYIDFLIKNGIDINQKSSTGRTALHFASMLSDYEIVKLLVESGIDVNATTSKNYNALMETCNSIFLFTPSTIAREEEISSNFYEISALRNFYNDIYRNRRERKELLENQLNIVKFLLENGIDKEQVSIDNNSALDIAIENCYIYNTKMVETLSQYGVPVKRYHNTNVNYFDALFGGGIFAFISESTNHNAKVRKLKAANKWENNSLNK